VSLRAADCHGVWVPLPTPFRAGDLALDLLPRLVDRLLGAGVNGFLVLGTTGEWPHLADDEAEATVRAVAQAVHDRVPVLAGSGRASTAVTRALGERLARAGADGLMVLTPHAYRGRMDAEALQGHYAAVAAAAPVPVFVYHMPDITGLDLGAELLQSLLQVPNVWGFKDSSTQGGPLAATLQQVRTLGFVGSGARFLDGLDAGAVGGILAIATVVPELCVALHAAWRARDRQRAVALQAHATAVAQALRGWGVAGIKAALMDRGETDAGPPRSPLRLPPAEIRAAVAAAIDAGRQAV
jgi:dihydrodipicolinate synthase/N-acetylneuraminate lyase